ncbi:MAG: hypothetical protein R3251_01010 [Candidatus Spechtbacterales bacterium]|nr:hypothetical protein [Candidatus Spechtbacterales bacterium]
MSVEGIEPEELIVKVTTEKDVGLDRERTRVEIYTDTARLEYGEMPSVNFYTDSTEINVRVRNRQGYDRQTLANDMKFAKKALDLTEKLLDRNN